MNHYNDYNIITLDTQILQLWHVKEKYYFMLLSNTYLISKYLTIVMTNGLLLNLPKVALFSKFNMIFTIKLNTL